MDQPQYFFFLHQEIFDIQPAPIFANSGCFVGNLCEAADEKKVEAGRLISYRSMLEYVQYQRQSNSKKLLHDIFKNY